MRIITITAIFVSALMAGCGGAPQSRADDTAGTTTPVAFNNEFLAPKAIAALGVTADDPDYERALYDAAGFIIREEQPVLAQMRINVAEMNDPERYDYFRNSQLRRFRLEEDSEDAARLPASLPQTALFDPVSYEELRERGDAALVKAWFDIALGKSDDLSFILDVLGEPAGESTMRITTLSVFEDLSDVAQGDLPFFQKEQIALMEDFMSDMAAYSGTRFYGYREAGMQIDPLENTAFGDDPFARLEADSMLAFEDEIPASCCPALLPASLKDGARVFSRLPEGRFSRKLPASTVLDDQTLFFATSVRLNWRPLFVPSIDGNQRYDRPGMLEATDTNSRPVDVLDYLAGALQRLSAYIYERYEVRYTLDRPLTLEGYAFETETLRSISDVMGRGSNGMVRVVYQLDDILAADPAEEILESDDRLEPALVYRVRVEDLSLEYHVRGEVTPILGFDMAKLPDWEAFEAKEED